MTNEFNGTKAKINSLVQEDTEEIPTDIVFIIFSEVVMETNTRQMSHQMTGDEYRLRRSICTAAGPELKRESAVIPQQTTNEM